MRVHWTENAIDHLVIKSGDQRQFAKPLKAVHLEYLKALDVKPEVFVTP